MKKPSSAEPNVHSGGLYDSFFSETGDRAPEKSSRYLQASGGRHNLGVKPACYHFVIRAILKREKSLKNMDFADEWAYSHSPS